MSEKQKAESNKRKVESLKRKEKEKREVGLKATENQSIPAEDANPANDSFDFGGLPERNLKKNLGCG